MTIFSSTSTIIKTDKSQLNPNKYRSFNIYRDCVWVIGGTVKYKIQIRLFQIKDNLVINSNYYK